MPIVRFTPRTRHTIACALGVVALAVDCARGIASLFARPRTVDAIALDHADRCRDVCEGPAWIPAVRDLTTPPWET